MSEIAEHIFRTKTGTCTITPDQIILSREGVRGAAAERTVGNSIGRTLMIYGILGIVALAFGIWSLFSSNAIAGVFLCLLGAFFLWNVIASRNNSAAPIINRSTIRAVESHPPRSPAKRGYFSVLFEEDGKVRKRLIMLPGSMENGRDEYERAVETMKETGLLSRS